MDCKSRWSHTSSSMHEILCRVGLKNQRRSYQYGRTLFCLHKKITSGSGGTNYSLEFPSHDGCLEIRPKFSSWLHCRNENSWTNSSFSFKVSLINSRSRIPPRCCEHCIGIWRYWGLFSSSSWNLKSSLHRINRSWLWHHEKLPCFQSQKSYSWIGWKIRQHYY